MAKCKTKALQKDLDTFRHNQAYPEIIRHIQAYSKPYVTAACLELRYLQNLTYSEPEAYPEP